MYTLNDLVYLMCRLRDPDDGCPWDRKQTYRSITPSSIEEVYELVAAIENGDFDNLKEELGDLVFQVIFYCRLAEEEQRFNIDQVIDELVNKLIRRHPHVFPDGTLSSRRAPMVELEEREIKNSWERIKSEERHSKGKMGRFDDIPNALPATMRALKIQKRAAKVGFDWSEVSGVLEKVNEELGELSQVIALNNRCAIEDELGDLFFTCVSLARHLNADPDQVLRAANSKFQRRFEFVESSLSARGCSFENASSSLLESLWNEAKASETR